MCILQNVEGMGCVELFRLILAKIRPQNRVSLPLTSYNKPSMLGYKNAEKEASKLIK